MKTKADSFPTVTVIARNLSSEQLHLIAEQMVATGIRSMEVSLVGDHACEDIRSLCSEFEGQLLIGAGTVLSLEDAKRSVDAGASFLLSPVQFGADVIDYAHECDVLAIPSGLTPTEIYKQLSLGADIIKVFPAARMTPAYLKDLRAPLGDFPIMVVGGINAQNIQSYLDAGARYAGLGTGCFRPEDLDALDAGGIRQSLEMLVCYERAQSSL